MATANRFDVGKIRRPTKTPQGFLRASAKLSRSGVFEYKNADGSVRRELRHPADVFHVDSLATLADAPLTLEHPAGMVTAENARTLARGHLVGAPKKEGEYLVGQILVTDADAIAALEGGKHREVSLGYTVTLDETPGTWQGERYDARQTAITYNHVALVPKGRAGAECRVRMDAAVMMPPKKGKQMATSVRIDGVGYDDLPEEVVAHIAALEADRDSRRSVQRADADFRAGVRARASLERVAHEVTGLERWDSLDDLGIRRSIIEKLSRTPIPADRRDDTLYLETRMRAELDARNGNAIAEARAYGETAARRDGGRVDAAQVYRKKIANLWREPVEGETTKADVTRAMAGK